MLVLYGTERSIRLSLVLKYSLPSIEEKICTHKKRLTTRGLYDMSQINNMSSHSLEDPRKIFGAGMM